MRTKSSDQKSWDRKADKVEDQLTELISDLDNYFGVPKEKISLRHCHDLDWMSKRLTAMSKKLNRHGDGGKEF